MPSSRISLRVAPTYVWRNVQIPVSYYNILPSSKITVNLATGAKRSYETSALKRGTQHYIPA
jgi:hypothetical protein